VRHVLPQRYGSPALRGPRRSRTICGSRLVCVLIARKVRVDVSQIRQRVRRLFHRLGIIFFDPYSHAGGDQRSTSVPVLHAIAACVHPVPPTPAQLILSSIGWRMLSAYARDSAPAGIWQRKASTAATPTRSADLPVTFAKFKPEICVKCGKQFQCLERRSHLRFKN